MNFTGGIQKFAEINFIKIACENSNHLGKLGDFMRLSNKRVRVVTPMFDICGIKSAVVMSVFVLDTSWETGN